MSFLSTSRRRPSTRSSATPSAALPTWVPLAIVGILALVVRGWQLSQRSFYWDDLVIPARFRHGSFGDFFAPYDGHIMPGSIAIQVAADRLAPLQFWLPVVITLVLSATAFVLYAVALTRLLPRPPGVRLLVFTAVVFSPFLMVASGWWSAALNALGWQLGFACVLVCVTYLPAARPSRPRFSLPPLPRAVVTRTLILSAIATAATCGAFLMTEKAVTLVPAAILVAWLSRRISWVFFAAPVVLTLGWAWFIDRSTDLAGAPSATTVIDSVPSALGKAVLPAIAGGPWQWGRWQPSQAFAAPSAWLWGPAVVLVVVLLGLWLSRRPVARALVLVPIVGYFAALMLVLSGTRTGDATTDLLTRNLHYYVDWWSVSVLLLAVSTVRFPSVRRHLPRPLAPILAVLLATSATVSTVTWVQAWREDPAAEYLAALRASLDQHPTPLLDQPVPLEILGPLLHPYNTVGAITGHVTANWTHTPEVVDEGGRIVPATVFRSATTEQGDVPRCGTRVATGKHDVLQLDQPLPFGEWTWEMNAVASNDNMRVTLTTPNGLETEAQSRQRAVTIPVGRELATQYVRVDGGGGFLQVEVHGGQSGDSVCFGAGGIGPLLPNPQ